MLLLSSWVVRAVGHGEPVALSQPFSDFPDRLDTWQGEDVRFSDTIIENKLGVTDYLSKIYRAGPQRSAHLYVGFYASQKHGEMIHSPKNCLPGNGWYIARARPRRSTLRPTRPSRSNSYIVENGIERQLVVYWYQQSGGRIVTNEYLGRVYLVARLADQEPQRRGAHSGQRAVRGGRRRGRRTGARVPPGRLSRADAVPAT